MTEMKKNIALKTNDRWKRDSDISGNNSKSAFSERDNRYRSQRDDVRGGYNRGYRDNRGYNGGGGRGGGRRGGRGGGYGRRGGYGRGRGYDRGGGRGMAFSRKPKKKNFVLPEGKRLETDFPTLGKPKVNNANDSLNWRIAAEKGVEAPPPPIFMRKMAHSEEDADSLHSVDLDDFDEEEYDSAAYCDDDDNFPVKGGYMD